MIIIRAVNKQTQATHEFTHTEWYEVQKSNQYLYSGTVFKEVQNTNPIQPKVVQKSGRGCGCKK
jgi:hypothetical protein